MYPYVPEHTADDVTGSLPIRCVLSGIGMAFFTTSVTTSVKIKMSNYSEVQEFFPSQRSNLWNHSGWARNSGSCLTTTSTRTFCSWLKMVEGVKLPFSLVNIVTFFGDRLSLFVKVIVTMLQSVVFCLISTFWIPSSVKAHRAILLPTLTQLGQLCSKENEEDTVFLPNVKGSTLRWVW